MKISYILGSQNKMLNLQDVNGDMNKLFEEFKALAPLRTIGRYIFEELQ